MISIDYFMSHGSPWTFLGHGRLGELIKKFNVQSYPTIALSKGRKYVEFDGDRSDINMFHSFFKKNGIKTV